MAEVAPADLARTGDREITQLALSRFRCDGCRGITVAGVPERGAVVARARELVRFAREQGYPIDELIQIIESVG
jgi:hypothetical protein